MDWMIEENYYEMNIEGYFCTIERQDLGYLCGYIHLSNNHIWLKSDCKDSSIVVHGGITYQNRNVIGFDCGHSFDLIPYAKDVYGGKEYRNVEYVIEELRQLAVQAYIEETTMNKIKIRLKIVKHKIVEYVHSKLL